jgi:2'-5' RNA ligase
MQIRRKSASDASRWNGQGDMMINLCTFGDQPWEMVKRATGVIGPICAKYAPLNLKLEGVVGLPSQNQPRIAALAVGGDVDGLKRLREEVARALAMLVPASEKEFQPLVILGRLKMESEQARTALGRAVRMTPAEVVCEWSVPEIQLLRSDVSPNGVQYQKLEGFPLSAQP